MELSQTQSAPQKVNREQREARFRQKGTIVWLTGLSSVGKTTVSIALENALFEQKALVTTLDGDVVRSGLNQNLGWQKTGKRISVESAKWHNCSPIRRSW